MNKLAVKQLFSERNAEKKIATLEKTPNDTNFSYLIVLINIEEEKRKNP